MGKLDEGNQSHKEFIQKEKASVLAFTGMMSRYSDALSEIPGINIFH
jgi:hypothetical protein